VVKENGQQEQRAPEHSSPCPATYPPHASAWPAARPARPARPTQLKDDFERAVLRNRNYFLMVPVPTFEKLQFQLLLLKGYRYGSGSDSGYTGNYWKVTIPVTVPARYSDHKE